MVGLGVSGFWLFSIGGACFVSMVSQRFGSILVGLSGSRAQKLAVIVMVDFLVDCLGFFLGGDL